MARMIDAEKYKEDLWVGRDYLDEDTLLTATNFLDRQPTIEAEPVRHGGWEHIHEGVYHKVRCTACGVDAIIANTYVYDTRGLLVKWAYCPNCGAKME